METSPMQTNEITVIITNWNYGMFLKEAIESVLNQTVCPKEIIIADDGSTDNSLEIETEYLKNYPELIRLSRQDTRRGLCNNLNTAIATVTTPFFCSLAADDKFDPTYIEKALKVIHEKNDDKLFVVYCDMIKFGNWDGLWTVMDWDEAHLRQGNYINGHAVISKRIFDEVGGYRTEVNGSQHFFEDYYLYIDIINLNKGYYGVRIPEALVWYRRHDQGHRTDNTDGKRA